MSFCSAVSADYEGVLCQAADARWSTPDPAFPSGISGSGSARQGPAPSSQQPKPVLQDDLGDVSQHFIGSHWQEGLETQGCICGHGQREPEGPCWPGSPYILYGGECSAVFDCVGPLLVLVLTLSLPAWYWPWTCSRVLLSQGVLVSDQSTLFQLP